MSGIKQNSEGVQPWELDKLDSVPAVKGVYVVRNLPTRNGIIFIQYSDNLKESLKNHWSNQDFPDATWFDWYEAESREAGGAIAKKWVEEYNPKFNFG